MLLALVGGRGRQKVGPISGRWDTGIDREQTGVGVGQQQQCPITTAPVFHVAPWES